MELFAESYDTRALREGNQWLLQHLQASEKSCKQYRSVIKQQQRRISALEADGECALDQLEQQWKARLQQKEKEWMQEYAAQTQSLLQIIQHQERVQARLEDELDRLRSCRTIRPLTAPSSAGADDLKCRCHHARTAMQPASCNPDTIDLLTNSPETSVPEAIEAGLLQLTRTQQEPGFRTSILQRLQRRNPIFFETKSRRPPTIPEEDEEREQEETEKGAEATGRVIDATASTLIATCSSMSTESCDSSKSVYRDLEEQNRVLQARLASQQTVLDRILDTKLQEAATSLPQQTIHVNTTEPVGQMIKLHVEPLPTTRSECIPIQQQWKPLHKAETDRLAPLSPPAA